MPEKVLVGQRATGGLFLVSVRPGSELGSEKIFEPWK